MDVKLHWPVNLFFPSCIALVLKAAVEAIVGEKQTPVWCRCESGELQQARQSIATATIVN